jgi:hypothetical protein
VVATSITPGERMKQFRLAGEGEEFFVEFCQILLLEFLGILDTMECQTLALEA